MSKGTVAYVGPFSFPNGGAAARRILGVAQTLQSLDYKVIIGSGQNSDHDVALSKYENIDVYSLSERNAEHYPDLLKHLLYFNMGKKTIEWLDSLKEKPKAIILYSGYSPYLLRLLPWCKKNKIPLIFDAVEWYDPASLLKGLLSPYYWNIEFAMRFLIPKTQNVIVISDYLERYYSKNNCLTCVVPPTLNTSQISARITKRTVDENVLLLGYAGSPARKDLFDNVLTTILDIDSSGLTFKLYIAGMTEKQLLNYPVFKKRGITKLPLCFKCYGVVSYSDAMKVIESVDFSILLRPYKRFAQAGFSTKFVESLSVGTPVLANHTSDLSKYLIDGETGIVCKDDTNNSLRSALFKAKNIDADTLANMRINARTCAVNHFDVNVHGPSVDKFLSGLL